jgi:hypothetical protein
VFTVFTRFAAEQQQQQQQQQHEDDPSITMNLGHGRTIRLVMPEAREEREDAADNRRLQVMFDKVKNAAVAVLQQQLGQVQVS